MNNQPIKKTFDCIEMKRKIQEKIALETEGMNSTERLQYYKQQVANSRFAGLFKVEKTVIT